MNLMPLWFIVMLWKTRSQFGVAYQIAILGVLQNPKSNDNMCPLLCTLHKIGTLQPL